MADWINDLAESAVGQWLNLGHAEQATQQGNYAVDAGNAVTGRNNRHAGSTKPKKQSAKAKKKAVPDYDPYSYIQNNDNAQDIGNAVASIMPEDTTLADSQADMTSNLVDSHYAMTPAVESVIGKNANDIIKDLAVAAGAGAVNSVKMMADTANMLTGDQFDWGQRYFDQASQGLTGDASKNYQGDARGMYSDEMIRQLQARAANEKAGTNFDPENLWDTARSHVADMVNSGFTMIPIVATGGALGRIPGLAKLSPEALSMVSNSLMNAGDTFTEARENGADLGSAYLGGLVSGGISAVADRLTGGGAEAGFLRRMLGNNNIEREVLEKELNLSRLGNIGNSVKNFLLDRAKDTAGEMAEESGNLLGADVARSSTQGTGLQLSSGRKYLNTAGNAGLQSLFGQAHGDIISNTQHAIENDRRIQEVNRNVDDIKQKLDRMSPTQQAVWEDQNRPDAQKQSIPQLQKRAEEIKNNREKGIEVSREEVKQGVIQNTVNEITGDTIQSEQQSPLDQYIQQKANEYRAEQMQKQEDDVNELNDLVQTVDAQRQQNDMLVAENQAHQEANQNLTAQNEELTAQNEQHQQTIEQQAIQQEQQNLAHSEQLAQQQVEHEADLAVQQESHQAEKAQIAQDVGQAMQAQQIQHEQEMQAVQQQAQQAVAQSQVQNAQPVSQTNEMQPVQQPVRTQLTTDEQADSDEAVSMMAGASENEQIQQPQQQNEYKDLRQYSNKPATQQTEEGERVRAVHPGRRLDTLIKQLENGELSQDQFNWEVARLGGELQNRSDAKEAKSITRDRERGELYVRERIVRAMRNGEIKEETGRFAMWVLDQAPHLAKELGVSVRSERGSEKGVAGFYNSVERIATLLKHNDNVETAVHEILHHAERMMPKEVQDGIRNEMKRQLDKAIASETNPETKALLQRMKDSHNGDSTARQEIEDAFKNRILDKDKHYQFMDASEFWTVNGSRLLHNQYKAQGNWKEKAKQFLRRMYNFFRNKMGMSSDAPVMRGLREVINGKGDFVDGARMLRNSDGQFNFPTTQGFKWEYGQRQGLFSLPDIKVTELNGTEFGNSIKEIKLKAAEAISDIQNRDSLVNDDTGWKLVISNEDKSKISRYFKESIADIKSVAGLEKIAKNAVLAESHRDDKRRAGVQAIHRLYAPVLINGKAYRAKITVIDRIGDSKNELDKERTNLHAIESIEIENAQLGTTPNYQNGRTAQPTTGHTMSVSELLKNSTMNDGSPWNIYKSLSNKQQSNPVVDMLMQNGMTQEQAEAAVKQMQDSGMLAEQKQEEKTEPVAQEEVKPVSEEKTEEEPKQKETEEQEKAPEKTTEETEEETESEPEDNGNDGENTTPPELQWHPKDQNWAQKKGDNLVRALQDKMVDVKRVQEAILRAALGDKFTKESRLDEDKDVYLQEGLYESKVKQRIDNLNIRYTKPILDRLNKLKDKFGRDMSTEEAGKWLYARHVILDKVNTKLAEKNGSDSGKLSGMTDEEAQEIYDRYKGNEDMEAVGKMVDKMVRDHLNQRVEDGLLSKETADQWIKDRPHYVPLKRDNILVTDEDGNVTEVERGNTMKSTGKGVSVRGSESNERKGSEREATNILANVFQRMEEGITRGEKNKVGQTMVRLVESAPNKNFWNVEKASARKEYGDNTIPVKINGVEHRIVFNADNELAMHVCKALQGTNVKQLGWFSKQFGKMNRYMGGWLTSKNPVFAFFNFLRDAQHMYFNLSDTPLSGKAFQVYKNYPSAMRGVWEVLRNGKEGKEIEYDANGLPKTSADWFREFQDSGAATGFIDLTRNPKERMKDLQKQLDRMKSDPVKAFRVMGQFLEDYNEIAENGTRLSVYMEARRNGMSKAKAADLARNITVDFNRKGTHTGLLGSFYLFANANIQGHARMFRAIKNSRKAQVLAGAMVGIGVAMSVIGRLGMGKDPDTGEDRWDQIPEHEKAQNYIVPIGWMTGKPGDYFKVPVAQGLNILPTTGRIMSDVAFDIMEGRDPNWGARLGTMLVNSIDAINVLGASGSPWQAVTPTALRPVTQWIEGKDWTGGALYKKDIYNTKKPAYTRAFKSTSSVFINTSKALSDITGGNKVNAGFIDIPPEVLKSFATTWGFPGWSNIASQAVRAVEQYRSYDSEGKTRLNVGDIPVLNRLVGDASSRKNISRTAMDVSNDMKDLHDKIENNRKALKKLREENKKDTDEYREMRENNRELLRKLGGGNMTAGQDMMDAYDDYISNLKAVSKKNTESMKSIKAQREKAETYDYDKRSEVNDKIDERENKVKVLYEERRKVIQQGFIKALENIKDGKRGEEIMKGVKDWNEVTF